MKSQINLKITNNTSLELRISILGVIPNSNSFSNIKNVYEFDMSGETFQPAGFSFSYNSVLAPTTSLQYNFTNYVPTIQGYVDALNTLNVGVFIWSGSTIYMFSNDYVGRFIKQ